MSWNWIFPLLWILCSKVEKVVWKKCESCLKNVSEVWKDVNVMPECLPPEKGDILGDRNLSFILRRPAGFVKIQTTQPQVNLNCSCVWYYEFAFTVYTTNHPTHPGTLLQVWRDIKAVKTNPILDYHRHNRHLSKIILDNYLRIT